MRVDQIVKVMPGDRQHRLAVEFGVVKTVQQMNAAGSGSGQTDAELTGVFSVAAGHERRRLFVAHLDEANFVLALAQGFHDPVDAVAGQARKSLRRPNH